MAPASHASHLDPLAALLIATAIHTAVFAFLVRRRPLAARWRLGGAALAATLWCAFWFFVVPLTPLERVVPSLGLVPARVGTGVAR